MKFGRIIALIAGGAAAIGCVAAMLISHRVGAAHGHGVIESLTLGLIAGALTGAATFPIGLRLDRELSRLISELGQVGAGGEENAIGLGGSLRPLRRAIQERFDAIGEQVSAARARIREADIRQHLIETEREQAEAVLDSLRDAVIVTDSFNELAMANEEAARLLGFHLDESLHRSIDDIVPDEALRRLIRDARDLATPAHRRHADYEMAPGEELDEEEAAALSRHFDVTLSCLPDPKSGVGGVVTILRDVTREREINQMKSDFVSKVSHELRTPLSSINAYIELLLDGEAQSEESQQEFYQIIKNEADRLNRLIDNMLNISRIEAGIIKIERAEVDFVKAAQSAIEVILPQAKLKEITVSLKKSPLACTAIADVDMIQQVMLNLLSNAVKYTPEGGRVTVTVENDDATRSAMVSIADTGLGIPPDAIDKVFDKFYRIENYKRVAKGTGLGLALVKHIVETVHQGHIAVTSELGMGSKFTFTIPYDNEAI